MERLLKIPPARFIYELICLYFDKNVARSAAALTYFLLLTFFPLLICANAFVGLLRLDSAALMNALSDVIPASAATLITDYVTYVSENQSIGMLAAGLTAVVLSASAALRTLMNTMDEIYDCPVQGGVRRTVFSVVVSLLFLVTMYLSMIVVLTGDWLLHVLETWLPAGLLALIDLPAFAGVWTWMKYLLLFCFVMLLVLIVYQVCSPRETTPRAPVIRGAIIASAALVGASAVFSWFIGMSSRYSLLYGSLASVIILMVWLYLCGTILILGGVFNCVWYRHKLKKT